MRIGFDLDGVVQEIDLGLIRVMDHNKSEEERRDICNFYYISRRQQLNPLDFCHENDELFFITGRPKDQLELTTRWKNKYYPMAKLVLLNKDNKDAYCIGLSIEEWLKKQAMIKARAIIENKIDVYFEDTPGIVLELRKICPHTKIIQYGGRILG